MHPEFKYYIEYNLTDKCNLNCKSCAAYSPLVDEDNSKSLDKIKKDFKKIYELSLNGEKIKRVTIMGGEPLLYKYDINKAIKYIATLFNKSEICLVTNGILIPKKDDEFFSTIKNYITTLFITQYPININYNDIYSLLDKWDINYDVYGTKNGKTWFYNKYLKNDYNENYKEVPCWYRDLIILRDNKVYPCTEIAYFDYFDNKFKDKHNLKVTDDDYIDLDKINTFEELYNAKQKITPFCGYCMGKDKHITNWSVSKKNINEWII